MSTSTLPETDGSTLESVLPPSPSPLPPLPSPPSLLLPPQDAPKKKASKSKKKEPTLTKRGPGTPFTVQETNDLRRFLRESQTIARACEKMAAAHPRRTAGTVRAYHSKNKDEFEDGLGSDAPYAPSWTSDEHSLLVKVLAGPVASLNSGFKAFSEKYSKRSVIAAAKYYQTNRLQLEAEIKAFQEEEPSSSSRSVRISYANESDSDNDSSTSEVRWGDEEAGDESSQPPLKRRKKPTPSIPYTAEETADLQRLLRESETLKEAAAKMEIAHPRRTAVSIGMYCYRHKEAFNDYFKARPPSVPWTKQEEQDLIQILATSRQTLLLQCQAVHDMHPHRTALAVSAYYFKNRERLTPLIDAIKITLPPPPPQPSSSSAAPPTLASIMSTIDTLLQNQPQPQPSSSKRSSEGPSSPSSSKRGRLDDSPPPESFYPSTSSGSVADLLALPRLAPPKPIKTKAPRKPRKSTSKKTVSVSVPVVDASNPPPSRIVLRLPFFNPSTSTSLIASEPSPCIKAKLELPLSPPPPPPPPPPSAPAPVVASPSTSNRRAPRASLPRFALPALPKLNES